MKEDTNTQLARDRTRQAADRTLMAWIRTAISLIGFGFTIAALGQAVEVYDRRLDPERSMRIFGFAFLMIGVLGLIGAIFQHRSILRSIARRDYTYIGKRPLALTVAIVLIAIGIFGTWAVLR